MLHKSVFDCNRIGDFYDCGCADDDDDAKKDLDTKKESKSTDHKSDVDDDESPPVEISKEPYVFSSLPLPSQP